MSRKAASLLALVVGGVLGCGAPADQPTDAPEAVALHDHGARHGGVVAMAGDLHVEAVALPDGRVRIYPSDVRRRPLPAAEVTGSVTVRLADGARTLPLVAAGDRLEASGPPLPDDDVLLHLALLRDGRPVDLHLRVPVAASPLAGLPAACRPPTDHAATGRLPRCTVRFPRMVRSLAATADARTALVAVVAHGVSGWRLPAAELAFGLVPVPGGDRRAEHVHPVDALAVRPDGLEVAVTTKGRLLLYSLATGELAAELPGSPLRFRALGWSPDSSSLLVSAFYDGAVHVLRIDDGQELSRLEVGRALSAFVLSPGGRLAALASELGPITVFDVASRRMVARLPAEVPAQALAFAGGDVVAARQDGALDVWHVRSGRRAASARPGPPLVTLAARADGAMIASGALDGAVRLHAVPGGALRETLRWHRYPVQALAWAGPLLLSGDSDGELAVWDVESPLRGEAREGRVRRMVPPARAGRRP
jgi:hypothetical protein